MNINATLVLSTFNWPNALELVLKSIAVQTILPQEVIIADDGSNAETKFLIDKFKENFPVKINHIWHEDLGNRKAKIMNMAIAQAKSEYIISIDGDVILHPNFIEDHLSIVEKNVYLYGSRVTINEPALKYLFTQKKINFNFFSQDIKKRFRTIRIPFLSKLQKRHPQYSSKMRGCNFSFWKDDFIKVNGYNEEFTGWGREDSELVIRMANAGIEAKRLKFGGIVYHIYHKEQSKSFLEKNNEIQENTIKNGITFAEIGVNQYT